MCIIVWWRSATMDESDSDVFYLLRAANGRRLRSVGAGPRPHDAPYGAMVLMTFWYSAHVHIVVAHPGICSTHDTALTVSTTRHRLHGGAARGRHVRAAPRRCTSFAPRDQTAAGRLHDTHAHRRREGAAQVTRERAATRTTGPRDTHTAPARSCSRRAATSRRRHPARRARG